MKSILKAIAIIELVGGIIASFFFARIGGMNFLITGAAERDWLLTIIIFVAVLFGCFVNFAILYAIYEILDNQELIYGKLNQLAAKSEPETKDESSPDKWKCPKCGKYNLHYVGTCGCGYSK